MSMRVFLLDLVSMVPYYTGSLCDSLRRAGVDAHLGSTTYHLDPTHFRRIGVKLEPGLLDLVSRRSIQPAALRRAFKLCEVMVNLAALGVRWAARPPDILHIQFLPLFEKGYAPETWLVRWAARRGARLVYTVHDRLPHDTGSMHMQRYQRLYQRCDALICHTRESAEILEKTFGIPKERLWTIPHGPLFGDLPCSSRGEALARLGLDGSRPYVLWQGIIKRYKGIPFLLEAWPEVLKQHPSAILLIAGSGQPELVDEIRRQVRESGLESSVRMDLSFLPVDRVCDYYDAADVVVYPYREITTSGALTTGMARSKALVATDLPAFQEVLENGRNALLTPHLEPAALAAAVNQLLADGELRARLGAAAMRRIAAETSWASIAGQTLACYEAVRSLPAVASSSS